MDYGVFVFTGLVGAGKSTLANKIGDKYNIPVISGDSVRKTMMGVPLTKSYHGFINDGIYSPEITLLVNRTMLEAVSWYLKNKRIVILDECFWDKNFRSEMLSVFKKFSNKYKFIVCNASESTVKTRLEKRDNESCISDGRFDTYLWMKSVFEPFTDVPEDKLIIIDTDSSIWTCIHSIETMCNFVWQK